jgi:hypothetical protein
MTKIIIWVLTFAVFFVGGYLAYKTVKNEPLPESFAFADLNTFNENKVFVCPVTFTTFEVIADTVVTETPIGNFPPLIDVDSRFTAYTNPLQHRVDWPGKKVPTPAQLAGQVNPYLLGAKVFKVENIVQLKKECYYKFYPAEKQD